MILVAGASQGIGLGCVHALLELTSARILMAGRTAARLDAARAELPAGQRDRVVTRVADQGNRADVDALIEILTNDAEPLEGAILAVGVNPMYTVGPQRLHALDAGVVEGTIRTNCTHTALLTTALLGRMRSQRGGVLVWIGSMATRVGLPGAGIYCATKSFLSGLARAAHEEYRSRGVRVHLVHPGVVRTARTAAVAEKFARTRGYDVSDPETVGRRIAVLFVGGAGTAVEVELC